MAGPGGRFGGWNRGLLSLSLFVLLLLGHGLPSPVSAPAERASPAAPAEAVSVVDAALEPSPVETAAEPPQTDARPEAEESTRHALRRPEARALPLGSPESVGMDATRLASLDGIVERYIREGLFPGAVLLVARQGVIVKQTAYGEAAVWAAKDERLAEPLPMKADTLFDVASLTKVFTTTAALTLVDQGRLDLDAPVANYLPEFAAGGKANISVRQLLSHTAGLPPGLKLWTRGATVEERIASAMALETKVEPGREYEYSDAGPIFTAWVIERITGMSYEVYLNQAVLEPLGMANTAYNPVDVPRERIAATEVLTGDESGVRWGVAHDGEARALDGVAGNAGLFSTASDVALLGQMMLDGGNSPRGRVLSPTTVAQAVRPQAGTAGARGIGWELGQKWYMGSLSSPTTFGHTGFTGTSLVVEPKTQTLVVLLTNSLHPKASGSTNPARRAVADAVHDAILR